MSRFDRKLELLTLRQTNDPPLHQLREACALALEDAATRAEREGRAPDVVRWLRRRAREVRQGD